MTDEDRDRIQAEARAEFERASARADEAFDEATLPALVHPVLTVEPSAWLTIMDGIAEEAHRRDRILDGAWATFDHARSEAWLERRPFTNMPGEMRDRQSIKAWGEFMQVVATAWADFHGVREEAWSTFNSAKAPAWKAYDEVEAVAEEARDLAIADAIAEYKRVTGEDYRP
jgi:hypothetical protein